MKKILYVGALILSVLAAGSPARAERKTAFGAALASNPESARLKYAPQLCRTALSGTCVVCSSAGKSGIISSIEVSSGAVGGWAVAIDTGAIPSIGIDGPHPSTGAGAMVARQKTCEYTLATVDTNKGNCGRRDFENGRPYSNGLTVCAKADTNVVIEFYDITIP